MLIFAWCATAGGRPGLLFDWALPLLAPPAGAPAPDFSTQFWAAAALGACLGVCDAVTLARYANAALGACQAVLEADATSADLLPPTLNAIRQVPLWRGRTPGAAGRSVLPPTLGAWRASQCSQNR